jgi:hypothetical protein
MNTSFDQSSADEYKFNHGQRPQGYGLWSFSLGRQGAWTGFSITANYSDAKRAAMREAKSLGCDTVTVDA